MTGPDQPPIRVVLCDDTRDIRLLLSLALELAGGFEVVGEAADGSEAIAQVTAHQPDVVLLDLAMPVLDGLQALPHIRERAPGSLVATLVPLGRSRLAGDGPA